MNDLERYFNNNPGRLIHKWQHYFDVYDRHFSPFRDKEIVIVEIGVFHGGSLQMWKNYFGKKARIYGIDINPRVKELEEEGITTFVGSQSDRAFLRKIKSQIPPIDILIDDGGHRMKQQIITFEELFGHVKPNGVYLCEDLLTSYQMIYGGGHKRKGTFIEYSKNFIDALNAYHAEQSSLPVNEFTRTVDSLHYYDSILVIEKKPRDKPYHTKTGKLSFEDPPVNMTPSFRLKVLYGLNKVLQFFRLPSYKLNK